MPRIPLSHDGSTPHERLLGHNPSILTAWLALESAFFGSGTFDARFREQVRRALAFGNQCEYCMAKAGPPDVSADDARISLAVAFAKLVGHDHRQITDAQLAVLGGEFSVAEIAELTAFVSFISASQIFGAVMGLRATDLPHAVSDAATATPPSRSSAPQRA